jgi:Flp pilus assembly pilin Flp
MVEYGLLCALISIVAIATLAAIGPLTANLFHLKYKMRMP